MKILACVTFALSGLLLAAGCEAAKKEISDKTQKAKDSAASATADAKQKMGEAAESLEKGFTAATDKAKSSVEGVKGGPELLTQITDLFAGAQKSLQGVTNSETATAASNKLSELSGSMDGMGEKMKALPESARKAITDLLEKGIAQLQVLADKVNAMPGVGEKLKPKLDEFIAKLTALKG